MLAQGGGLTPYKENLLWNVKVFAFGGVGFSGQTSAGEKDFRAVLSEPPTVALQKFEDLYANGSPESKAYALAGIHKLDSRRFKVTLEMLRNSQVMVATMEGCIVEPRTLLEVAKRIDSGRYDYWINFEHQPR